MQSVSFRNLKKETFSGFPNHYVSMSPSQTTTTDFYKSLPVLSTFFDASNTANHHPLPNDWYAAVSDITNSTKAIEKGKYKAVNIVGVSSIVAILNTTDRSAIPYIFGGDGAAFCFPPNMLSDAHRVLATCRQIGLEAYGLNLRASIIPVSYIQKNDYTIRVARYRVSDVYVQAVFSGGGLQYAEQLLKNTTANDFSVSSSSADASSIDFSGLECRWQKVRPSEQKKVITLLIQANKFHSHPEKIYNDVLQKMRTVFNFDEQTYPIPPSSLNMTMSFSELMGETRIRTFGKSWFQRIFYLLRVELQIMIGKLLMKFDYKTSATDWSLYKKDLALNTDHRKFDDMLRLVISGTDIQLKSIQTFLEEQFKNSNLAYGIHVSDAAIVTCMVNSYYRDHIHFVDGSDGGYVAASKDLKKRINSLANH